jgi:streptogramin lyase
MLSRRIVITALAAAMVALLVSSANASAAPHFDGHFTMPEFDGSNNKIAAGPDGNMWMGINEGEFDVAKITPAGAVEKFKLQDLEHPAGITAGPEGRMWVTDTNKVGSFLPSDPEGTRQVFTILTITAKTPIVYGPDNQMWVAATDNVVHFSPSDPEGTDQPISVPGLAPKDIDVAGSLLVVADSSNKRLVTVTPGGAVDEVPLLGETTTSQGVAGNTDGQIAFSKSDGTEGLGLVKPPAGPTAVEMPGDPFGAALGSDGAYYFAMSAADNVQRLTPDGKAAPIDGFPPKFFPRQIAPGPNNTIWVTMEIPGENTYEVARISGLEPPAVPISGTPPKAKPPETKISKGPKKTVRTRGKKAKVTFKFSSSAAGAKFECALVKVKKGKKAPKPKFKGCKSPKKYSLKPGKYRFSVRAVLSGVADPSPATKSFKVVHVKR